MKKTFCGALLVALVLAGCGGGGSGGGSPLSVANAVPVKINGSGAYSALNSPMVSVKLCRPGTNVCATIPDIVVDSGSSGLVLNAAAIPASLNLQTETLQGDGNPIGGCTAYGGGVAWGPIATADVQMADEVARSVPVELAAGTGFSTAPSACSDQGPLFSSTNSMGANGILGIAGDYGYTSTVYYDCTSTNCTAASPLNTQTLTGVIGKFAGDNNGAILSFPPVAAGGAPTATGTLTFGLNTQANNSTASVSMVDGLSNASMTAMYNGISMDAILDSGSFGEILGSAPIATCTVPGFIGMTWFCPTNDTTQTASYQYAFGGSPLDVTFTVSNAQTLLTQTGPTLDYALPNLAEQQDLFGTPYLDLGMSFLYGHTLYIGYPLGGAPAPTIGLATTGVGT